MEEKKTDFFGVYDSIKKLKESLDDFHKENESEDSQHSNEEDKENSLKEDLEEFDKKFDNLNQIIGVLENNIKSQITNAIANFAKESHERLFVSFAAEKMLFHLMRYVFKNEVDDFFSDFNSFLEGRSSCISKFLKDNDAFGSFSHLRYEDVLNIVDSEFKSLTEEKEIKYRERFCEILKLRKDQEEKYKESIDETRNQKG